ncbi:amidase [Roseinatronobacter alkalisoli]|uniref:Amidase family protein n=1 Tax=Roseinatronobacter alkalisoli TaxID=3028235 RepID=A0ABT5TCS3_9RHOB|nr:amidase family protein [Roseinatronobacter sp. HJB301]MDD7972929.1 amidase family protein [Roseinatronobacter sp. HJB301]
MADLFKLSAFDLVAKLKSGAVAPTQAVEAAFDRIAAVEDDIRALPTLCKDRALAAARQIEASGDARKHDPTWLAGLPIAVKDLNDVAGVRTTYGSPIFANHVPDRSDYMVERLEANGAIVIGKSNTPEFGAGGNTFNQVFPPTVTPWDTRMTASGSSGGAAAALAAGEVWMATGSDYGGSLRTPAAFCGIVGLRPSPGRVANGPNPFPFDTIAVEGPMARNVRDVALMLDAMAGIHPGDPLSLPAPALPFADAARPDDRPRRVAYSRDLGVSPVHKDVADACDRAVEQLASAGWEITEDIPDFSKAMETFHAIRAAYFAAGKSELVAAHRDMWKPDNIWNTERGLTQSGMVLAEAERQRGILFQAMVAFFETHDLLLAPCTCMPPFPVGISSPSELNGYIFKDYMDWLQLTAMLSITSCPILSLPVGLTPEGLPVGMQVCGPPRGDRGVIAAAFQMEKLLGLAGSVPIDPRKF